MKNRAPLVFGAVLVLMGGYLAWDLQSEKKTTERKQQDALLFPFNPDQVNEITIENSKGKTRLTRSVDGWKLEEPIQEDADNGFSDDFVERGVKDHWLEIAKEGEGIDWKVYGLDAPSGKVTFKTQAGESRTIEVSPKQNFEQNSIVRFTGENRVLIVPAGWAVSAGRDVMDFRDKRLYRHKIGGVDRIEVKNANGSFALSQKEGKWSVDGRPEMILDQNRVRELLSMINETRAAEFLPESEAADKKNLALWGVSKPVVTINLTAKEKTWSVAFGRGGKDKEKSDYALLSQVPSALKLEPTSIAKFEASSLDGLRDKKLPFEFDKAAVQKIELETPLKKTSFSKTGAQWSLENGSDGAEADSAKLTELVDRLKGSQAARFADPAAAAKYKPFNKIKLLGDGGKDVFEVSWGLPFKGRLDGRDATVVALKTSKSQEPILLEEATLNLWSLQSLVKSKTAPAAAKATDSSTEKATE